MPVLTDLLPVPAVAGDRPDIEALLDRAFGADRRQRTTYRLRDTGARLASLSRVVREADGHLCGSIEFWPVDLVSTTGEATPAILLGPIAVDSSCQGRGVGTSLMRAGLRDARAHGHRTIILVGDPGYYERFGFSAAPTQHWQLPGPVDAHRLLVLSDVALPAVARLHSAPALLQPYGDEAAQAQQ